MNAAEKSGYVPQPGIRTVGVIPPEAEVTRVGRWSYRIVILDGMMEYGPDMSGIILGWRRLGRERAERKARKELARYVGRRPAETFRVAGTNSAS